MGERAVESRYLGGRSRYTRGQSRTPRPTTSPFHPRSAIQPPPSIPRSGRHTLPSSASPSARRIFVLATSTSRSSPLPAIRGAPSHVLLGADAFRWSNRCPLRLWSKSSAPWTISGRPEGFHLDLGPARSARGIYWFDFAANWSANSNIRTSFIIIVSTDFAIDHPSCRNIDYWSSHVAASRMPNTFHSCPPIPSTPLAGSTAHDLLHDPSTPRLSGRLGAQREYFRG